MNSNKREECESCGGCYADIGPLNSHMICDECDIGQPTRNGLKTLKRVAKVGAWCSFGYLLGTTGVITIAIVLCCGSVILKQRNN